MRVFQISNPSVPCYVKPARICFHFVSKLLFDFSVISQLSIHGQVSSSETVEIDHMQRFYLVDI